MNLLLDSFWRALAYCVRPRVIALSFLPLVLMIVLASSLGYFFWENALDWVRAALESSLLVNSVWVWLQSVGAGSLKMVLAPLIVVFAVTPLIVVLSLLTVAGLMTPALTLLVSERRFPQLERKQGGSLATSMMRSLGSSLLALIAIVISIPLWLVPLLILILPPLIWGWLTYRVMTFDALAEHASPQERREIISRHRPWLLGIGIFCGYLGSAPGLIWASGALLVTMFVILLPLAIWLYTLVFAFSSLWYAHYCLAALQALRAEQSLIVVLDPASNGVQLMDAQAVTWVHDPANTPHTPG